MLSSASEKQGGKVIWYSEPIPPARVFRLSDQEPQLVSVAQILPSTLDLVWCNQVQMVAYDTSPEVSTDCVGRRPLSARLIGVLRSNTAG
mgnify:CR=1 FL=1